MFLHYRTRDRRSRRTHTMAAPPVPSPGRNRSGGGGTVVRPQRAEGVTSGTENDGNPETVPPLHNLHNLLEKHYAIEISVRRRLKQPVVAATLRRDERTGDSCMV